MKAISLDSEAIEHMIVGKLIGCLLDDSFRVEISNHDGGGTFVYASVDGGHKPRGGFQYWVKLVPGNGADVISDYTTNLETIIKPANDLAASFMD